MLELDQLLKTFNPGTPNEVRALRGVSLRLERGSFLIIIGTNGSGKSTLLNAVAGTFLVDTGCIRLAGQDITGGRNTSGPGWWGACSRTPSAAPLPP
jgi:putative ABC transport system ATP-binding protein